jgi:hypothetical protein
MALRHGCDAQQPSGTCHLHLDEPPPWSSAPHIDIRLVVAVNAHAQSATDGALLRRCLCTVHEHHPLAWIHVVDNGSPDERSIAAAISRSRSGAPNSRHQAPSGAAAGAGTAVATKRAGAVKRGDAVSMGRAQAARRATPHARPPQYLTSSPHT